MVQYFVLVERSNGLCVSQRDGSASKVDRFYNGFSSIEAALEHAEHYHHNEWYMIQEVKV